VILRLSAGEIVHVHINSRNVTVAEMGSDVGLTHVNEVRTQASDRELADVGHAHVHRGAEEKCANQLVTDEHETRDGTRCGQLIAGRLLRCRATFLVDVLHHDDLKLSD